MSQKKAKKTIEVRDLMPAKDAKGGGHHGRHRHHGHGHSSALNHKEESGHVPGGGYGIHMIP